MSFSEILTTYTSKYDQYHAECFDSFDKAFQFTWEDKRVQFWLSRDWATVDTAVEELRNNWRLNPEASELQKICGYLRMKGTDIGDPLPDVDFAWLDGYTLTSFVEVFESCKWINKAHAGTNWTGNRYRYTWEEITLPLASGNVTLSTKESDPIHDYLS